MKATLKFQKITHYLYIFTYVVYIFENVINLPPFVFRIRVVCNARGKRTEVVALDCGR